MSLIEQLLCEPEDRLGSQNSASVSRPDSLVIQARRSGFFNPPSHVVAGGGGGGGGSVDGVELIKASRIFVFFFLGFFPESQGNKRAGDDRWKDRLVWMFDLVLMMHCFCPCLCPAL